MNPATLGTPCLVPVQVEVEGGSQCRGFITRLAPDSATVSSDPPLQVGATVRLQFRSPVTGESVTSRGEVREALDEGGLWRGRSAALVMLESSLEEDVLGPGGVDSRTAPQRRGSEGPASLNPPPGAGLSGTLKAGLGRRHRTSANPLPLTATKPSAAPVAPESDQWQVPDHLSDEHTAPPRGAWLTEPEVDPVGAFGFTGEEEVPPVRATDPELPRVATPQAGAPPRNDESDDDFFGKFGQVEGIPEFMLPQGAEDSGQLGVHPDMVSYADEEAAKPDPDATSEHIDDDGYFDPARSGKIEVATRSGMPSVGGFGAVAPGGEDLPSAAQMDSQPGYDAILNTAEHEPDPSLLSDAPPVRNTMSIGDGMAPGGGLPPWEAEGPRQVDESLIPRNARIASSLPVSFWARGRSNKAVAQNFSKEGLYLAYKDTPPVRGAIVRIEFPVEGDGDSVPIRFNAEVRWQSSDRPGSGRPEGFGVQILTFESPKDRRRYDELLMLILSLHENQSKRENEQEGNKWSWETGSRS
ncbi:MAG: PilZ domain-containing protein [Proteobacteria bacterium]|nr:PilZ domain-containing protein [Pseudomonadota bacterium]